MHGYQFDDYEDVEISVVFSEDIDRALASHLDKGPRQEDLTFAYWRPSRGTTRFTAIINEIVFPGSDERILQGNVAFTVEYLDRVIRDVPPGCGIALLHSHLGPGWQDMSDDDKVAERDRMGGAVAARTNLPVLGLTWATDGTWSARLWLRKGPNQYERRWAETVRVVGRRLRISFHPKLRPMPAEPPAQEATISVWGKRAHADIVRSHVGVAGLGSVGSIVAESLSRVGLERVSYIDHDLIELRNLDRTLGATPEDVEDATPKVEVARRLAEVSHTSSEFESRPINASLLSSEGLAAALDCDVIMSCVDRPWPKSLLNTIAKAHLIPIVDGGILARVDSSGLPLHVDWRIHTVGPGRRCLYCLGALLRSDVALDMEGKLDDPDYLKGLSVADRERYARRNVFAFSLSVASHQTLQFIGLVTGMSRVGGVGPQHYARYPGMMNVDDTADCDEDCEIDALVGTAIDLDPAINSSVVQLPMNPVSCVSCGATRPPELATGAPRTPCPQCGATGINVHVNLHETLSFKDSVSFSLHPADQERDWRRRWEAAEREVAELQISRHDDLSTQTIHAARHQLHSFFVQTYHLKDALKKEASATGIAESTVEAAISSEPALALLADLANLDKHGNLNRPPRSGHVPVVRSVSGSSAGTSDSGWRLVMAIEHDNKVLDGVQVAQDAVSGWRKILTSWRLI